MQRWLGNSLKRKLSIIIIGSILIPLLSLGYILYSIAALEAEERAKQSSMNLLRQIDANLEFIVQDVENMSIFLIGQEEIQKYLSTQDKDGNLQIKLMGFLSNLVFSKKYISNITIYPSNGNHAVSTTTILNNGLPEEDLNKTMETRQRLKWWTSLYENRTITGMERVISLLRPIGSMTTYQTKGVLSISINEASLARILAPEQEGEAYFLLLDQNRYLVSGGQRQALMQPVESLFESLPEFTQSKGFFNYGSGRSKKTMVYYQVPSLQSTLLAVIPFEQFQAQSRYVLSITALAVGLAILIIVAVVLYLVQRVTKPLRTLARSLKSFKPEDDIVVVPVTSSDEIGMLIHSHNKLSERIQRLKEQVQRNEALKKEADMLALQAQINPHFLYNTLASVHWMALMNRDAKIAEMVGSLSDFLRFSLNKGSEYCQVRQEIEHAKHYASIQNIRYPGQFQIVFEVDPAIESSQMLKLLLQPLIENALTHGIMKQQAPGYIFIRVTAVDERYMQFTIEDTGVGMPPAQLERIVKQLDIPPDSHAKPEHETGSYGLRNVHQRLKLHYDACSGLTIESIEGEGTQISFKIPYEGGLR